MVISLIFERVNFVSDVRTCTEYLSRSRYFQVDIATRMCSYSYNGKPTDVEVLMPFLRTCIIAFLHVRYGVISTSEYFLVFWYSEFLVLQSTASLQLNDNPVNALLGHRLQLQNNKAGGRIVGELHLRRPQQTSPWPDRGVGAEPTTPLHFHAHQSDGIRGRSGGPVVADGEQLCAVELVVRQAFHRRAAVEHVNEPDRGEPEPGCQLLQCNNPSV